MAQNIIAKNKVLSKKAQSTSDIFKYLLAGLFSVVILAAGYITFNMMKERACNAEIAEFEIGLKGVDKYTRGGQKEFQSHSAPCGSEQIYFFDMGKNINTEIFNETPILQDAVKGKSNNIFLVKEKKFDTHPNPSNLTPRNAPSPS